MTVMPALVVGLALQLLVGAFAFLLPDRTRPDLFFAVTVDPGIRGRLEGRTIVARYRRETAIVIALAVVLLAGVVRAGEPWGLAAGLFVELAGLSATYYRAHRRTLPFAAASTTVRESALEPGTAVLPAAWVQAGPFALLAGLAWYLQAHWNLIPEQFPVHWNLAGQPDRWASRSVSGVYGGLIVSGAVCLLMLGLSWGIARWTRPINVSGPAAVSERRFKRAMLRLLLAAEYVVSGIFAVVSWSSVHSTRAIPVWWLLTAPLAFVATTMLVLLRMGQGGSRLAGAVSGAGAIVGDRTDDRHWKAGVFYVNGDDPALFVEKRFGGGYTINMAHPGAWLILGAIVAVVVLVPWLARAYHR
ncbi:MAG: DUF1648 domain-containing protein [Acidobacteriota bacterium]|nr:DUF1648 domain-containing protein [Acidobacteriota bacterium]